MTTGHRTTTLVCRLREHVTTREGDLIPMGCPVTVLGWATAEDAGKIEVRAAVYVYPDEWEGAEDSASGLDRPAVGRNFRLAVHPGLLEYVSG